MNDENVMYKDYFNIDQRYFPNIDPEAIRAGARWEDTYPHETFVNLLEQMEHALARQNDGRTLWIEGAYGTGKSQCAYALRKVLTEPEETVKAYWDRYEPLRKNQDLRNRLEGHKKSGIVVADRFASGDISSPRDLFYAVQKSVYEALERQGIEYRGENALVGSIIAWLEDSDNEQYFNLLLSNPNKRWQDLFAESNAEEVLDTLRTTDGSLEIVRNILSLADEEGITALKLDADRLIAWLSDIIDTNRVKIVLVWDEFSDYFKRNHESLTEFQKIAALVQSKAFYFVIVTHESQNIYVGESERGSQRKVSDRFVSVKIELPDNIAFQLIADALKIKESRADEWGTVSKEMVNASKNAREHVARMTNNVEQDILAKILPIHPMTALVLTHIASAFQSNQRSIFNFIKSKSGEQQHAFQWFIANRGPYDDRPFLTIDELWDFFYEHGKDNLSEEIRQILDSYNLHASLRKDEEIVLKAVLILQALNRRYGGMLDSLAPTAQNLFYVFEGTQELDRSRAANIAKGLVRKGVLLNVPGRVAEEYNVAVVAGDQETLESFKAEVRKAAKTATLVAQGKLGMVLELPKPLERRFAAQASDALLPTITNGDFHQSLRREKDRMLDYPGQIKAVLAFARDNREAHELRTKIKEAVRQPETSDIVFIGALSTPIDEKEFKIYVDQSAMALYYQNKQAGASREAQAKADRVLAQDWAHRIADGHFVVYSSENPEGKEAHTYEAVHEILKSIAKTRFPYIFDFVKGLTASQLLEKLSDTKSVRAGIDGAPTAGQIKGIEKKLLDSVWNVADYWRQSETKNLPISVIKRSVEELAEKSFRASGRLALSEFRSLLLNKYGFLPSPMVSFLGGFLLKEYATDKFRYSDANGHTEPMTATRLSEMVATVLGKRPPATDTFITRATNEERAFYQLTQRAWALPESVSDVPSAIRNIKERMQTLRFPWWTLETVAAPGDYSVIEGYAQLMQSDPTQAQSLISRIGQCSIQDNKLADRLHDLLTEDRLRMAMREYVQTFDGGSFAAAVNAVRAINDGLADISDVFSVENACLWNRATGEDQLRYLRHKYEVVRLTNEILPHPTPAQNFDQAEAKWKEALQTLRVSMDALARKQNKLSAISEQLKLIYLGRPLSSDQLLHFEETIRFERQTLKQLFEHDIETFSEVYKAYLINLSPDDVIGVRSQLQPAIFLEPFMDSVTKVKAAAEEMWRRNRKTELTQLWREMTGTEGPDEWSARHRTPILAMVPDDLYAQAKQCFEAIERSNATEQEINSAIDFLRNTSAFECAMDNEAIDEAFKRRVLEGYAPLLNNLEVVRRQITATGVAPVEWIENPVVKMRVKQIAENEYASGASARVAQYIDELDMQLVKDYLKRLAEEDVQIGARILSGMEKD